MTGQSALHTFLSLPVSQHSNRRFPIVSLLLLVLHILFFNGTLDIFFTSPLVNHISTVHRPGLTSPPAQRVVLFVVDGLTASTLFRNDMKATPHLRSIVRTRGASSGLSIARTPTLSRPGHLSLLSGVYELMHGLSRPPTEMNFDSVANRSAASFLLGEDEVVELFSRSSQHVHAFPFPVGLNDFSMSDPTQLDRWVFRRLSSLLSNRTFPFPSSKLFFMTHLLGVDTFSHSRSASPDRLAPLLANVDAGVARAEAEFRRTFGDDRTAFLLTADHGMSSWSAHGAGDSEAEVETPLLAWGAGIGRGHGAALKVSQVDVCPLISALLDINFPVHSVGQVPMQVLNVSVRNKREIARANTMQVVEQFLALRREVKERAWIFSEFRVTPVELRRRIAAARAAGDEKAVRMYGKVMEDSVQGLYHFHKHPNAFRLPILITVFILTLLACVLSFLRTPNSQEGTVSLPEILIFLLVLSLAGFFLLLDGRGVRDWTYVFLLVYLVWGIYRNCSALRCVSSANAAVLIGLALVSELMVIASSWRPFLCVPLLCHLLADLHFTDAELRASLSARLFQAGLFICAVFMFVPLGWPLCFPLVYTGPVLTVLIVAPLLRRQSRSVAVVLFLQLCMIVVASINHFRTHYSIQQSQGMPTGATIITKTILLLAPTSVAVVSRLSPGHVTLLSLWLSVTAAFTPFCLFVETIFLLVFCLTLGAWVSLHRGHAVPFYITPWPDTPSHEIKSESSMKTAYFGMCFLLDMYLSCYGIGNVSNISSYDPHFVLCFQGVFDLNVMTLVVFLKNTLPLMAMIGYFLTLMHDVNRLQILRLVVIFSGVISVHNYFFISEDHSWLRFAAEINHFTCNLLYMAFLFLTMPLVGFLFPPTENGKVRGPEFLNP